LLRTFNLDFGLVARMTTLDGVEVFIVDNKENLIKVIDLNGDKNEVVRTIQPKTMNGDNRLKDPMNISVWMSDKMLISNYYDPSILVFNANFEFVNEIKNVIDEGNVIDFMEVDDIDPDRIYMVRYYFKKVSVFNLKSLERVAEFEATEPWNIKAKNEKLFLVSLTFWEWDNKEARRIKEIRKGANCVFVMDKSTFMVKETIKFDDWLRPEGFYFDKDDNILTTAFKIDKKSMIVTDFRFLFIINQRFEVVKEIYLDQITYFSDFLVIQNKFLFCGGSENEQQWVKILEIN
jgi:hypothetical protein